MAFLTSRCSRVIGPPAHWVARSRWPSFYLRRLGWGDLTCTGLWVIKELPRLIHVWGPGPARLASLTGGTRPFSPKGATPSPAHLQDVLFSSVAQSCPAVCNPMGYSPPGSSIHGILQARILEWVAIAFSRGSSWPRDQTHVSCAGGQIL